MFKILVVEDDCALNHSVCAYLDANGFEATGCLNADDACDKLFEGVYDLIISDIMMPGTDGFAFAEEVRDFNKDIPILFMTARGDIEAKRRGFRIGIDDYVEKPVDLEELKMRIGALLRRSDFSLFSLMGCRMPRFLTQHIHKRPLKTISYSTSVSYTIRCKCLAAVCEMFMFC